MMAALDLRKLFRERYYSLPVKGRRQGVERTFSDLADNTLRSNRLAHTFIKNPGAGCFFLVVRPRS
jgi:hypothetical protein